MSSSPEPPASRPQHTNTSEAKDNVPIVHGINVTPLTQCTHWHSPLDIIAIKHFCCQKFYACVSCHDELESHTSSPWPRERWKRGERDPASNPNPNSNGNSSSGFNPRVSSKLNAGDRKEHEEEQGKGEGEGEGVILCGQCKHILGVEEYINSGSRCTNSQCGARFNPGCKKHWKCYFEIWDGDLDGLGRERVDEMIRACLDY